MCKEPPSHQATKPPCGNDTFFPPSASSLGPKDQGLGTSGATLSVSSLLRWGTHQLNIAGVEHPDFDAEMLLRQALGISRAAFFARLQDTVAKTAVDQYDEYISRRAQNVPVQYIIGKQEFMGLEFHVTSDVLIPRPETELLVELLISRLSEISNSQPLAPRPSPLVGDDGRGAAQPRPPVSGNPRPGSPSYSSPQVPLLGTRDQGLGTHPISIADIGCGSGAIAISLAHYMPDSHLFAVDISPDALAVARGNAEQLGVAERITFLEGDLLNPLERLSLQETLHAIVSNPPYIPRATIATLDAHVQSEPHLALDGGIDGLDYYRRIAAGTGQYLIPGGLLAVEVGHDQAEQVAAMFQANDYGQVEIHKDLAGIGRVVIGTKTLIIHNS